MDGNSFLLQPSSYINYIDVILGGRCQGTYEVFGDPVLGVAVSGGRASGRRGSEPRAIDGGVGGVGMGGEQCVGKMGRGVAGQVQAGRSGERWEGKQNCNGAMQGRACWRVCLVGSGVGVVGQGRRCAAPLTTLPLSPP